jgi:hypothetical protein
MTCDITGQSMLHRERKKGHGHPNANITALSAGDDPSVSSAYNNKIAIIRVC